MFHRNWRVYSMIAEYLLVTWCWHWGEFCCGSRCCQFALLGSVHAVKHGWTFAVTRRHFAGVAGHLTSSPPNQCCSNALSRKRLRDKISKFKPDHKELWQNNFYGLSIIVEFKTAQNAKLTDKSIKSLTALDGRPNQLTTSWHISRWLRHAHISWQ